jgi:hypothetical protein
MEQMVVADDPLEPMVMSGSAAHIHEDKSDKKGGQCVDRIQFDHDKGKQESEALKDILK